MQNKMNLKVRKIEPWSGPISVHEGKTLVMTDKVFVRNGKCSKCGDSILMSTIYENDHECVECRYKLPKPMKRRF